MTPQKTSGKLLVVALLNRPLPEGCDKLAACRTFILFRRHAEVVKQEGVSVRRDFDLFGRAAGSVTGFGLDADQHGRRAALFLLDRRRVLERMRGDYAVVVIRRRN